MSHKSQLSVAQSDSLLVYMNSTVIELTKCTRHAAGPLIVCPATLIHCCGCILGAMLYQRKPQPVVHKTEHRCRLGRRTEVSDICAFVFPMRKAVAIIQHKACGCRAGNVINPAAVAAAAAAKMS